MILIDQSAPVLLTCNKSGFLMVHVAIQLDIYKICQLFLLTCRSWLMELGSDYDSDIQKSEYNILRVLKLFIM